MRTVIFGNIANDHYPINNTETEPIKGQIEKKVHLTDRAKQTLIRTENFGIEDLIAELAQNFRLISKTGGGGYNALKAFSKMNNNGFAFLYYDLSKPIEKRIRDSRIEYGFRGLAEICSSIILPRGESDRQCLTSTRYDRSAVLSQSEIEYLAQQINACDVVFINSIANQQLVQEVSRHSNNKKKYVVVTKKELAGRETLENSTAIIDIEEGDVIGCGAEKSKENIINIIDKLLSTKVRLPAVTLGEDGVAFYNNGQIKRMHTKYDVETRIQDYIRNPLGKAQRNGSGDFFAASLIYNLELGTPIEDAIRKAQIFVIQEKLKYKHIKEQDFEVEEVKQAPGERVIVPLGLVNVGIS